MLNAISSRCQREGDDAHKGRPYAFRQLILVSEQDYHKKHLHQAYMFLPIVGTAPFHYNLTLAQSQGKLLNPLRLVSASHDMSKILLNGPSALFNCSKNVVEQGCSTDDLPSQSAFVFKKRSFALSTSCLRMGEWCRLK